MNTIVVLLNWNSGEYTIPCIESLLKSRVPPSKIIVIDNGSTDGSPERIDKEYPLVELIRNKYNVGFAAGSNQGIRRAIDLGADFVWLLNNDTLVDHECLGELLKAARRFPTGACFSGKIYLANTNNVIWYAGGYRHCLNLGAYHSSRGQVDNDKQDEAKPVSFLSGCCMLFPRWALDSLGLFIDDYFCFSEDNEWCWRATSAGVQLFYVPSAKLWHHVSASASKNDMAEGPSAIPAKSWYFLIRNHLWTVRLWAKPSIRKYIALIISFGGELRMVVRNLLKADCEGASAVWKGMLDGIWKPVPRRDND